MGRGARGGVGRDGAGWGWVGCWWNVAEQGDSLSHLFHPPQLVHTPSLPQLAWAYLCVPARLRFWQERMGSGAVSAPEWTLGAALERAEKQQLEQQQVMVVSFLRWVPYAFASRCCTNYSPLNSRASPVVLIME